MIQVDHDCDRTDTNIEGPSVKFGKLGCVVTVAGVGVAVLALLAWPYRLETVESTVLANSTGCAVSTQSYGGWREKGWTSQVAYPLQIFVFVEDCAGAPQGRPYSAELKPVTSGKVIALGLSCSGTEHAEGYPCRLEMPPLTTLVGHDQTLVRVVKVRGQKPGAAEVRLFIKREWRSAVLDAIMSV